MDILLTPYSGKILGPIARVIGWIMNGIYIGMSKIGWHNVGVAIILLTIVIYLLLFPLTYRQQKFSKLSQKMQPEIKAVQDKYKGKTDQASMQAMNQETQLVYQKYGISPMGSCLQLVIQMPILFALYRVFYNVPAYLTAVKDNFSDLANGIIGTKNYADTLTNITTNFKTLKSLKVDFSATGTDLTNYVVDVLYKLPSTSWTTDLSGVASDDKVNYLVNYFPKLSSTIDSTAASIHKFNYFLGLNISDTPWNIIKTSFSNGFSTAFTSGTVWIALIAILFPVCSFLTQRLNIRLTPQTNTNDQTAQSMKMMNFMMPFMSLFFCFTLPVGLGIYWIAGALVRSLQQFLLNKHFDKMNLEDIIEKNKEKVEKKKAKMGAAQEQMRNAAALRTKSLGSRASFDNSASADETDSVSNEDKLSAAAEIKQNAQPGSLAAKANMVKQFNEKNSRK